MGWPLAKAHAYGNDFLYLPTPDADSPGWDERARRLCHRHTGAGADGLILYDPTADGARMRLFNADGSPSEVSGNGVRGLAALLAWQASSAGRTVPDRCVIHTDAGPKHLTLLTRDGARATFRAAMGHPTNMSRQRLDVEGGQVDAIVLRVGNPQCVVLEDELSETRYRTLGPQLERHPTFQAGSNVEFVQVVAPDRVRILIWERGVGPTTASGTGACASAVAAMAFGGLRRTATVSSPGGDQVVEWTDAGMFLTGWAEVLWEGTWIP